MPAKDNMSKTTQLSHEAVLRDVKQIVAGLTGAAPERIREDHLLEEDLGCDSITMTEIVLEVEEHFDVSISDEHAQQVRKVGDIVEGVLQLVSN